MMKDEEYRKKLCEYAEQPYMMTDIVDTPPTRYEKFKMWLDLHSFELVFGVVIVIIAGMGGFVLWSNTHYHKPVYEIEVNGHRCIGVHQTVDLTRGDGVGSTVWCEDGSVIRNAVNVRYIRLIREGYYFKED